MTFPVRKPDERTNTDVGFGCSQAQKGITPDLTLEASVAGNPFQSINKSYGKTKKHIL